MSKARLANNDSFASLGPRPSKLNAHSNVRWHLAFATLRPSMPARELAELLGWRIRFAGRGICRKAARLQVRKSGVRSLMVRKPDIFGHSDIRTFGLSDIRTFGLSDQWGDGYEGRFAGVWGGARKRRAPATHKMAGDCDGASRVPGSKDPKWFIPGPRDERKSTGSGGASVARERSTCHRRG